MAGLDRKRSKEAGESVRRVTVRDIAVAAGVSPTSVSFALRGNPRASATLRDRILKIADEMGYVPDPRMGALARYRAASKEGPLQATLAWLNLWDEPGRLYQYREFELYRQGASEAASRLGFQLEEVRAKGLTPEELARQLKARSIRGILLAPHTDPVIDLEQFPLHDFTVVRFGLEIEKPILCSITASQVTNGILAFERVREKGYERIGFVSEMLQKMPFGAGLFWAQKELPKSRRVPLLLLPEVEDASRVNLLADWVEKEHPDAIITHLPAIPRMLQELGYRIPEDIALATTSIHDTPIDAGIDQLPEEIGRVGLLTLVSLMNEMSLGPSEIQNQTLVAGDWVEGSMMPSRIPGGRTGSDLPEQKMPAPGRGPTEAKRPVDPAHRVTQRDIAKALGVSHVTVSLALRNDPRASAKTRARIQKKAEELGYMPDPMLSALGHYCLANREHPVQSELAWFNLWEHPRKLYSYREFDLYWKGAVESARRHGFQLVEFIVKDFPPQRLDTILKTRNVRGILVPPSPLPAIVDLSRFPWQDYVAVKLGVTCPVPLPYSVASDTVATGELALDTIMAKGYQRIAFVGDHAVQRTFGSGFYWAQRKLPAQLRLPMFFLPLKEPAKHRKKLAAWLLKERPDAIITDNGELPVLLSDLGYRIPDDIALASITILDTPIDSGIDTNAIEIGRMGVVSLVSHMRDFGHGIPEIQSAVHVKGTWIEGGMMPSRG